MLRRSLIGSILLAVLAAGWATSVEAASPLTADKMIVALRPELPGDRDYLAYVADLLQYQRIPRHLVESTFLWAREKPRHKYPYFKRGLIVRADSLGIEMPEDNPPLTGTIEGRVVRRFVLGPLKVETPVAGARVSLKGTDRKATTNAQGEFTFADVPSGYHTVQARDTILLVKRYGSDTTTLPTKPPSREPARVFIVLR